MCSVTSGLLWKHLSDIPDLISNASGLQYSVPAHGCVCSWGDEGQITQAVCHDMRL